MTLVDGKYNAEIIIEAENDERYEIITPTKPISKSEERESFTSSPTSVIVSWKNFLLSIQFLTRN